MDDWFSIIDARCEMSEGAVQDLREVGFVVIPGPVALNRLPQFAAAYDSAVACAAYPLVGDSRRFLLLREFTGAQ